MGGEDSAAGETPFSPLLPCQLPLGSPYNVPPTPGLPWEAAGSLLPRAQRDSLCRRRGRTTIRPVSGGGSSMWAVGRNNPVSVKPRLHARVRGGPPCGGSSAPHYALLRPCSNAPLRGLLRGRLAAAPAAPHKPIWPVLSPRREAAVETGPRLLQAAPPPGTARRPGAGRSTQSPGAGPLPPPSRPAPEAPPAGTESLWALQAVLTSHQRHVTSQRPKALEQRGWQLPGAGEKPETACHPARSAAA